MSARVIAEARSWLGTPFYPHMAQKKVGADCVHLALAIYKACKVLPADVELPDYSLGNSDHLDRSIVIHWLASSRWFAPHDGMPEPGMLITLKVGRVEHHVGISVGPGKFVHSVRNYGVIESDLRDSTWKDRLRSVWRPVLL